MSIASSLDSGMTASGSDPSPTMARVAAVTTPPSASIGIFGRDQPLPPTPGTQSGTWNEIEPTVLFHHPAIELKAPLKGAPRALPTPESAPVSRGP